MEKFDEVAKIIEEVADIPVDEIEEDSSLIDDLDLSSLEIMTILNNVSRKFGVKITEQQTLEIETVGDIVKVL
ncbi:acyl carrier protein [Pseudobutyrivibrio sp. OR37]|uniref:acyl carrier protein n=1 Tax=Pseudobutyrivibrio sp. OR37 TaxID=1798186 RepID=UPI0008EC0919|nr:phosphopantetheine-binding protein [Pseudobutyrivibrio sp. OR37]SFI20566.1 acyl carrier protein [Pseudobutyrivibrio sp. OR37]